VEENLTGQTLYPLREAEQSACEESGPGKRKTTLTLARYEKRCENQG